MEELTEEEEPQESSADVAMETTEQTDEAQGAAHAPKPNGQLNRHAHKEYYGREFIILGLQIHYIKFILTEIEIFWFTRLHCYFFYSTNTMWWCLRSFSFFQLFVWSLQEIKISETV